MSYTERINIKSGILDAIIRDSDKFVIPITEDPDKQIGEYKQYLQWKSGGGAAATDPDYTLANIKEDRLAQVRGESESIIYAKWPITLQNNLNAEMAEGNPTLAASATFATKQSEIKSVQLESNRIESAINAATDIAAVDAAVASAVWPIIGVLSHG